ncbi:MAG TPA: FliI/YscN family ATPase [Steroidobacteraceae bacterium]|nr:FliI/YscN family ATPase [Steroidobacteraceae bacterium]
MNRPAHLLSSLRSADWIRRTGQVVRFVGLSVESRGPDAHLGEICEIQAHTSGARIPAEVIGLAEGRVMLMPDQDLYGIELGDEVTATGQRAHVLAGRHLLGRVIDGNGAPLDGKPLSPGGLRYALYPNPINPLGRGLVCEVLETGVRAIDTLFTLARGQRVGIFAGSGVGKSTLLGMLARQVQADVSVVALVGERGREVKAFVESGLSAAARARTVVVAATSDQPPLIRRRAAFLATAVAEYFRDQGLHVCLTMDSLTRVAMAQREIGLASGELPTARGYTPSVFSLLPRLLERGGVRTEGGSLTALYTVLVEGDDIEDPIADNVRAILDGHIVLSRQVAQRGRFPAIDVSHSISRLAATAAAAHEHQCANEAMELLALYESARDLIEVGAYRAGANPALDRAVQRVPVLEKFLAQRPDEIEPRGAALAKLRMILEPQGGDGAAIRKTR